MTLQAALEHWETRMPADRSGLALRDVDAVLRARVEFLRALLEQGWELPVSVRTGLARDLLLLQQPHGLIERGMTDPPPQ